MRNNEIEKYIESIELYTRREGECWKTLGEIDETKGYVVLIYNDAGQRADVYLSFGVGSYW